MRTSAHLEARVLFLVSFSKAKSRLWKATATFSLDGEFLLLSPTEHNRLMVQSRGRGISFISRKLSCEIFLTWMRNELNENRSTLLVAGLGPSS